MAKRFTDTGKWDKFWFRKLGSKLRDVRSYILDRCDHAGLIELDFETFEHYIGERVTMDELTKAFRGRIEVVDDKIFVPDFIEFQYKCKIEDLNPANKAHLSVIERLKDLGLFKPLKSAQQAPCRGAKDKDKDKDKDNKNSEISKFDFESAYRDYPLKRGKDEGLKRCRSRIKDEETFKQFCSAVRKYASECRLERRDTKYIKHFSSFVGTDEKEPWRDYIADPPDNALLKRTAEPPSGPNLSVIPDNPEERHRKAEELRALLAKAGNLGRVSERSP